jgi:hypothetical protein
MSRDHARVTVLGNTLNLAGIAASLKADANLEVVNVFTPSPNSWQKIKEIDSSVVIFDLTDPFTSVDITLLHECPDMMLIGVDPGSDEVLVLSCRPHQALSVADLVDVIHHKGSIL